MHMELKSQGKMESYMELKANGNTNANGSHTWNLKSRQDGVVYGSQGKFFFVNILYSTYNCIDTTTSILKKCIELNIPIGVKITVLGDSSKLF